MHMATHSKEKAYACVQCNKSFGQAATLKKHMLTHSGVKALRCSEQRVKCLFLSEWQGHLLAQTQIDTEM